MEQQNSTQTFTHLHVTYSTKVALMDTSNQSTFFEPLWAQWFEIRGFDVSCHEGVWQTRSGSAQTPRWPRPWTLYSLIIRLIFLWMMLSCICCIMFTLTWTVLKGLWGHYELTAFLFFKVKHFLFLGLQEISNSVHSLYFKLYVFTAIYSNMDHLTYWNLNSLTIYCMALVICSKRIDIFTNKNT